MAVVGLSGGGPYTWPALRRCRPRGRDRHPRWCRADEGSRRDPQRAMDRRSFVAAPVPSAGVPLRLAAAARSGWPEPFASPSIDLYGRLSPEGDRRLLARPEFKAMFLDDLLNGGRKQLVHRSPTSSCSPGTGDSG